MVLLLATPSSWRICIQGDIYPFENVLSIGDRQGYYRDSPGHADQHRPPVHLPRPICLKSGGHFLARNSHLPQGNQEITEEIR